MLVSGGHLYFYYRTGARGTVSSIPKNPLGIEDTVPLFS